MGYISIKNEKEKNYGLVRKTDLNLGVKYPKEINPVFEQ